MDLDDKNSSAVTLAKRNYDGDNPRDTKGDKKRGRASFKETYKRDRENATVFIEGRVSEEELRQCLGPISIESLSMADPDTWVLELNDRESKVMAMAAISFSRPLASRVTVHDAENTTVWVTNFPAEWAKNDLESAFLPYGSVLEIRLPSKTINIRRRFAYVQFKNPSESAAAVVGLDGVNGMVVKLSKPEDKKPRDDAAVDGREVYLSRIPFRMVETEVTAFVGQYSNPSSVRLPKSVRANRENDGYAFVVYETALAASQAVEALNEQDLGGMAIRAVIAQKRSQKRARKFGDSSAQPQDSSRMVYISDLDRTLSSDQLEAALSKYASVAWLEVDHTKRRARAQLSTEADAGRVVLGLDGTSLNDSILRVSATRPRNR